MSNGPVGGPVFSVEELQALVGELRKVNAGLRDVIAGKIGTSRPKAGLCQLADARRSHDARSGRKARPCLRPARRLPSRARRASLRMAPRCWTG